MNAITITLSGKKSVDVSDELVSLHVEKEANQMPFANIRMTTGNFADRKYPLFDEANFNIGEALDVKIRYEESGGKDASIFKGIITNVAFEMQDGLPIMALTVKDPCFRLFESVNTELFNKKNDKQMITSVLSKLSLSVKKASASLTSFSFDQYVKKQNSDWVFVADRLAAHGLLAIWDNGSLSALDLSETTGALTLDIGIDDILDMNIEQDASDLNQEIQIDYWNIKENKIDSVKKKTANPLAKDAKTASSVYTILGFTDKKEADAMLRHFENAQTLSALKGTVDIVGNSSVELMQKLTLKNFPKSMNGAYPITKVVHSIRFGVWKTTVGIGNTTLPLESAKMIERICSDEITDIQTATALKWEKDPESLGRIPVKVLGFSKDKYWAFPAQVSAGAKQSSFILPEEGEQLMIGFMHGDYNQGVVLTSIYSGSKKPPAPFKLDAKTPVGFISKAGLKHIFDDEKKSIESSSSSSNKVVIDDKAGIELKSKKDLKISSSSKTEIKASATVTVKGSTINLN